MNIFGCSFMDKLIFYTVYPLLWVISRLPFPLLYAISNLLYYLLYYAVGYRKKVVMQNLALAFPTKTEAERRQIARDFYRHLSDIFIEIVKGFTITREELLERMQFTNLEQFHALEKRHKGILLVMPHYASWEWAVAINHYINRPGYAIYQPIANPYFDRMVRRSRAKMGTTLISVMDAREIMKMNSTHEEAAAYGVITDQSPTLHRPAYWSDFFGIRVPIHIGAEKLAKKWNMPVVYLKVDKIGRGRYEGEVIVLAENSNSVPDFQISTDFMKMVEESVRKRPELYFWTHKRWKHRGKEEPTNSINFPEKKIGNNMHKTKP